MIRFYFSLLLLQSALLNASTDKPNLIFILADDLGYMDIAAYAAQVQQVDRSDCYYETPNLDQLFDQSMVFTQAYAYMLCSPTRASVITGVHASKWGFMTATPGNYTTYYNQGRTTPEGFYPHDGILNEAGAPHTPLIQGITNTALPREAITIAEALNGYTSAFLGKWHLGGHGSEGYSPADQGFQELAWYDGGGSAYFNWHNEWNKKSLTHPEMSQEKLQIGSSGQNTGEDYLTDELSAQACRFIEAQANTDKPFLLYYCPFAVHTPLQAEQADIDYFESKPNKGWNGHRNPTYAAMLKSLDESIGAIRASLARSQQAKNTVIIFYSDNGGLEHLDETDTPTITENSPFKGGKALVYEGGIRVPLMVHAPDQGPTGTCNIAVDCNDIFPTLLQFAQQAPEHAIDGHSIIPLLHDPQNESGGYPEKSFYWHYPFYVSVGLQHKALTSARSAIRKGDWKLILDWEGQIELFNIEQDPHETSNLAEQHPEKSKALLVELCTWLNQNVEPRYIPRKNPNYAAESTADIRPYWDIFAHSDIPTPSGKSLASTDD